MGKPWVLCLLGLMAGPVCADPVHLTGSVGPYAIEAELERVQDGLEGRYRYTGKDTWLFLSGETFAQDALQLTERFDGSETGQFFLAVSETGLSGFWASETADYPVELSSTAKLTALFEPPAEVEVDAGPTGQYHVGAHWVNDLFAPNYEIGFNGGTVNVAMIDADQILVHFDFVVGPTYHIASFRGVAQRIGSETFEHNAALDGGEDPCHLRFDFQGTGLSVSDHGTGWACQFGARAHANFDLQKVSNVAEFQDRW